MSDTLRERVQRAIYYRLKMNNLTVTESYGTEVSGYIADAVFLVMGVGEVVQDMPVEDATNLMQVNFNYLGDKL